MFVKFNKQTVLNENVITEPSSTNNTDTLTPLDQKFVTFEQLSEHYRVFINRIQQQLSTLGGGGAVRIQDMDDIDRSTVLTDGNLLKYDATTNKFVGATEVGGETLHNTLGLGNNSTRGMSVGVVTATAINLGDNAKATFGSANEVKMFHTPDTSDFRAEFADTNYIILTKTLDVKNQAGNKATITAFEPGGIPEVRLFNDGNEKLRTTGFGVTIFNQLDTTNIVASGIVTATDFNSTSDIKLKKNIKQIEDPISKIMSIEGVSFNWKSDNRPSLGVIADQLENILPELVSGGDTKTVNYNGLVGLLIECVKNQQKQIDELKDQLNN